MSDKEQGATTTQGQSIPTALFEKMFGKDNGMPGRDELLSTMQDRSESIARYKVGDEVLYGGKRWIVRGVVVAYMVDDASGELGGIHVAESMLRPANEAAQ